MMRFIFIIIVGLSLSACDRRAAYLTAQDGSKLIIPPELSRKKIGDAYTIPPVQAAGPLAAPITPPED